jgi:hypothetical protein
MRAMAARMNSSVIIVCSLLWTLHAPHLSAQESSFLLGDKQANRTTIVIASESGPGTLAAATRLQFYLSTVTGHKVPLWTDSEVVPEQLKEKNVILAGRLPANRWTSELLNQAPPVEGNEGFSLFTMIRPEHNYILVRAFDDSGVRYGFHRLLEEVIADGIGTVRLPSLRLSRAPAVKGRILGLFWNGGIPPAEAAQKNPENWPIEKLHLYMDLMDALGFNGLQTWDNLAGNYRGSEFSFTRTQWRSKLIDILAGNHLRGWTNLLFVWANTIWDVTARQEFVVKDLGKEENLRALGEYYDYQASLAPYLDYFISHNVDPGEGKSLADVQMLHLMLRGRFAKQNALTKPAFSYWFMFDDSPWWGWKGPMEQGALRLLDMKMMPPDSIQVVGVHGGRPETWKQTQVLRDFKTRGFETGIWAWYWADFEYQPGLHVHASRLQKYFDTLPREVAQELVFHTVDSSNHEVNLPSLYTAAQMLWDPNQKAVDLIRRYCIGLYGPKVGPVISEALLEIDRIRCANPYAPGFCGAGTSDIKADLNSSLRWVDRLRTLQPDPAWTPKYPLLKPLQAQIADVQKAFQEVGDFARFRIGAEELKLSAKQAAVSKADLERMLEKLPPVSRYCIESQRHEWIMSELKKLISSR